MKLRDFAFVVLGVALAALIGIGHSVASAQPAPDKPEPKKLTVISVDVPPDDAAFLVPGKDLALQVDRNKNGRVVGTLMAKIDGKWQPVALSSVNTLAN